MSKYGVTSGPYFPVFSPKTGKHGPEITPYLDTFHPVNGTVNLSTYLNLHFQDQNEAELDFPALF